MTSTRARMPSNVALGMIFGVVLVLALLAQLNLQLTFARVQHPVPLGAANLEPDVQVVRGWYAELMEQGTYRWMLRTELVDLFWAIALAAGLVALYRFVGGLLRAVHPPIASGLFRWAPLAAVGPGFDLVENGFSLAMLTDPSGFPDWWSVAHVAASWLKIVGCVAAAVIGPTLTAVALIGWRLSRKADDAGQALPPWRPQS